jgi:hypothetical protein
MCTIYYKIHGTIYFERCHHNSQTSKEKFWLVIFVKNLVDHNVLVK